MGGPSHGYRHLHAALLTRITTDRKQLAATDTLLDPTSSGMHRASYQRDHFNRVANDKVNQKENESIFVKYDRFKSVKRISFWESAPMWRLGKAINEWG